MALHAQINIARMNKDSKTPLHIQWFGLRSQIIAGAYSRSEGYNVVSHCLPYADLQRHYAALGQNMPEDQLIRFVARPAQAHVPADIANGIAEVPAVAPLPINILGGINDVYNDIVTFQSMFQNLPETAARNQAVATAKEKQLAILKLHEKLKQFTIDGITPELVQILASRPIGLNSKNLGMMFLKELITEADNEYRIRGHTDAQHAKKYALRPFTSADLTSAASLTHAITDRQRIIEMLPAHASITFANSSEELIVLLTATPALTATTNEFHRQHPNVLEQTFDQYNNIVNTFYENFLIRLPSAIGAATKVPDTVKTSGLKKCSYWLIGENCKGRDCHVKYLHPEGEEGSQLNLANFLARRYEREHHTNSSRSTDAATKSSNRNTAKPNDRAGNNDRKRNGTPRHGRAKSATNDVDDDVNHSFVTTDEQITDATATDDN